MQIRCTSCGSTEEYPDDFALQKVTCSRCGRSFIATGKLAAGPGSPSERERGWETPASPGLVRRSLGPAIVCASLVAAALFARSWLAARRELDDLKAGLERLALEGGSSGAPSPESPAEQSSGRLEDISERITPAGFVIALQEALVKDLNEKLEKAERRLERSENALSRERDALKEAKKKLDVLLKENGRLRRQVDDYAREISLLRTKLRRR